jgi:tetratricopeptide (TPR) repeat protein
MTALLTRACLVFALGSTLLACARPEKARSYAKEVQKAHTKADRAKTADQRLAAAQQLGVMFDRPPRGPRSTTSALRQDLADRAARLHLDLGEPERALEWVKKGREVDDRPSVLQANLLITEADSLVALGERDRARQALLRAVEINQALLNVELENP